MIISAKAEEIEKSKMQRTEKRLRKNESRHEQKPHKLERDGPHSDREIDDDAAQKN